MSVLDIDAGNTRLKWRLVEPESKVIIAQGAEVNSEPELMVSSIVSQLATLSNHRKIVDCRLASVRSGSFIFALCCAIETQFGLMPRQPQPANGVGSISVESVDPAHLGVDRWLAMLGAHHLYPNEDVMIVDAGTAITVDIIDKNGHFQGGLITPGLNTMLKAMVDSADLLVMPAEKDLKRGLTFSSIQAIQNGVLTMVLSLIERESERYADDVTTILCGGDGPILAENLTIPVHQCPELVFAGLDIALPLSSLSGGN